jgi:hypothetical protein
MLDLDLTQEIAALQRAIGDLEVQTLLDGEWDDRPAVITIRAGAGGVDAADFAEMLMRMYLRWAEKHGYSSTVMDTSYAEEAGIKSATFEIDAPYAFGTLSVEAGTHRLVRMSPFGAAADQFVFKTPSGQDVITDFTPGQDKIELDFAPAGNNAFQCWLAQHATQQGADTLISFGNGTNDSLLLKHVALSDLHTSDFIVGSPTHAYAA